MKKGLLFYYIVRKMDFTKRKLIKPQNRINLATVSQKFFQIENQVLLLLINKYLSEKDSILS